MNWPEDGERCVCELTAMVGADMSTVSRHLAILKGVGIVEDEKRGAQVYYRLRVRCVLNFFECVESVLKCNVKDQRKVARVVAVQQFFVAGYLLDSPNNDMKVPV